MTPAALAIDVALIPPHTLESRLSAANAALAPPPAGFRFDDTHVPHITLVQAFVPREQLTDLLDDLRRSLIGHPALTLHTTGVVRGSSVSVLGIARTPALDALHRRAADLTCARSGPADPAGFVADPPPRPEDLAWVASFPQQAAYDRFDPHITLGVGGVDRGADLDLPATSFTVTRVAVYRLGRFCTCRRRLDGWTLTGSRR